MGTRAQSVGAYEAKTKLGELLDRVLRGERITIIESSIFLPANSIRKGQYPAELTKSLPEKKVLYTFCVVGMRAKKAAAALEKQGFTVRALKPGYDELLNAGFKKAETKKSGDENTRQRNAG